MQSKLKAKRKVREFVDSVALSIVKAFYPSAAAKYANIPLDEAFTYLLEMVDNDELILKWELRCPNFSCVHTIDFYDTRLLLGEILCPKCGEEFDVTPNDYYPVFELQPELRDIIRQEKKTKNRPYLQLQVM